MPEALRITLSTMMFVAFYLLVRYGWTWGMHRARQIMRWYDRVLNHHLLLDIPPRVALMMSAMGVLVTAAVMVLIGGSLLWGVIGAAMGMFLPAIIIRHIEHKRRDRLESQLVDGITTLTSGVRAGLNIVQAMELLYKNSIGPLRQEIGQMLREYQMGLDLNHAMRNAADRIGSTNYRLLFTALEMHRTRGGDAAESLDRIAESVREIQRLEGKLDALTAQGRTQANMMAAFPAVLLVILYMIMPDDVERLFTNSIGRLLLLASVVLILVAFLWIRRILSVDI